MNTATSTTAKGRLLLVPAPLDFGCAEQVPLSHVLPAHSLREAARIGHWIVENAKSARAYLKRIDAECPLSQPLQAMQITELPRQMHKGGDHAGQARGGKTQSGKTQNTKTHHTKTLNGKDDASALLAPALQGHDVGLLSEAGMPAVADPGSSIVRAAHRLGLHVVPLVGPVSLLMALASSGLNGQSFAFVGYLPVEPQERAARIRQLETLARQSGQAQIVIETPYRNARLWQALLQHLQPGTWLSISAGLSLPTAMARAQTVAAWRREGGHCPADDKTPAVFSFGV